MLLDDNSKISLTQKFDKPKVSKAHSTPWQATWLVVVIISFIAGIAGSLFSQNYLFNLLSQSNFLSSAPIKNGTVVQKSNVILQEESATTEAVKKAAPAVVSIIISKDLSKIYNQTGPFPFDNDFFGPNFPFQFFFGNQSPNFRTPQGKQEIGGGTGFVIDQEKGLILTNRHVVEDTEAEYAVLTNDGKKYEAQIVARDSVNDMALVQIKSKDLPQVSFGDSDQVVLGQTVIAIGNALGEYRNTITKGVISGIGRNVVAGDNRGSSESLEGVFQTDAAINPGNSGGPLVNLEGQVIGINTAINQSGQLIGFAIPVNEAKRMIASFSKYGKIVRPYLGIRYVLVTPEMAKTNKLEVNYGALITRGAAADQLAVIPGSPADKAGLVENDIILEVNGQKVDQNHSLVRILAQFSPGETVKLKIFHKGANKEAQVKLEEFKESS